MTSNLYEIIFKFPNSKVESIQNESTKNTSFSLLKDRVYFYKQLIGPAIAKQLQNTFQRNLNST